MNLSFTVLGVPAPQGSKKGFVVNGRAVLVEDAKPTQKAWRGAVAAAAHEARNGAPTFVGPVAVTIEFRFPRPKSARKTDHWKSTKPDIDKVLRSTLDGLTDAGLFRDDALVVEVRMRKFLTMRDGTGQPGAYITVNEVAS